MEADGGGRPSAAGTGEKEGAEAVAGGGSPDGPALQQLHRDAPSGVPSDVSDEAPADIPSKSSAVPSSRQPRLSPPLAVPGAPPPACSASAPLANSVAPAAAAPTTPPVAPTVLGGGGGKSSLIATCANCDTAGPTSAYILCHICRHPSVMYCNAECRDAHQPKHQGEGEGEDKAVKEEGDNDDLKDSECDVYKRERQIAEVLGTYLPPVTGNPSQGHAAAAAYLKTPPIDARCSLCDSYDQVDDNGHNLVRPCKSCTFDWVHPTCLARKASREGASVLAKAPKGYAYDTDDEAKAEAAEEQLARAYLDPYKRCLTCQADQYCGSVSLALAELAMWDSEIYTYGGQEGLINEGLWSDVRINLARGLVARGAWKLSTVRRNNSRREDDQQAQATTQAHGSIDEAEGHLDEVLDVLGDDANQSPRDVCRMMAHFQMFKIYRLRDDRAAQIDALELCMTVVAETDRSDDVAAYYRTECAKYLHLLNQLDNGEDNYQEDKPLDVHIGNGDDDGGSQVSGISERHVPNAEVVVDDMPTRFVVVDEESVCDDRDGQDDGVAIHFVQDELDAQNNMDDASSSVEDGDIVEINNIDDDLEEYRNAQELEPPDSEAYYQLGLSRVELMAGAGRYIDALQEIDQLMVGATEAFGPASEHPLAEAIRNHQYRLVRAEHRDWVPELPSTDDLVAYVRAVETVCGADSKHAFRAMIYLIAKHVQSGQVDLGIRMLHNLKTRADLILDESSGLTGRDGQIGTIRDRLACGAHPWLDNVPHLFTGVTVGGSGRNVIVSNNFVQFEWKETEETMEVAFPLWGDTEDGLEITFLPDSIVFGGSENTTYTLLGRVDVEASSWEIERGVQTNSVPGGCTVLIKIAKAAPGEIWRLPYREQVPEEVLRQIWPNREVPNEEGVSP